MMKVNKFIVEHVPKKSVNGFIRKHHYTGTTKGMHVSHCFALFKPDGMFGLPTMIGAMTYGIPAMPGVAERYYPDDPSVVIELNRLCCVDDTPTNTESFFIGKTLKWLKDNTSYRVILSYADSNQGHTGVIYKATNFKHVGMTEPAQSLIADGIVYHSRCLTKKSPKFENIRKRIKNNDKDIQITKLPPKYIYVIGLDRKRKKHIMNEFSS